MKKGILSLNKKEIKEIKKQFTHDNCNITKISGCYVDVNKDIKTVFSETFLCLPEEETFKYFEILKKTLSGQKDKNIIDLPFVNTENQKMLLDLQKSELKNEKLLNQFYNKVIRSYDFLGNYLILLVYGAYDVPGKTNDQRTIEDSDEVYSYILCSMCPVELTSPGISYYTEENVFKNRLRDYIVSKPLNGFLFPAFNDRSSDIHNLLYYSKNDINKTFIDKIFGVKEKLSASEEKKIFNALIETSLSNLELSTVVNLNSKITSYLDENAESNDCKIDSLTIKKILKESGAKDGDFEGFENNYEALLGANTKISTYSLVSEKAIEIKTEDFVIKIKPDKLKNLKKNRDNGKVFLTLELDEEIISFDGINVTI